MFGIFKKKPLLEDFSKKWLLENYEWAMRNCGSDTFIEDVTLILPTDEFFPKKVEDKKQLVRYAFEQIKNYALMSDWPIDIIEKESNPDPVVGATLVVTGAPYEAPMDTIYPETDDEPILITYSLELTNNLDRLVASFAYELARIFSTYIEEEPPCEEDTYGHNVELVSIFLGFGIILINSAFQFEQYTDVDSQGWKSSSVGFLSQYEMTYALAIFCELKSVETNLVERSLDKNLLHYFIQSREELVSDEKLLWRLRNINSPIKNL